MVLHYKLQEACQSKKILKVIIGLDNFNVEDTIAKVQAAEIAGGTYVDIAANIDILQEVKAVSSLPICVSSIHIDELVACHEAGADILEIGNFDIFYGRGIQLSQSEVFYLAAELKYRLPEAAICVTIPHQLNVKDQIQLVQMLDGLSIDLIQTEGISSQRYYGNHFVQSVSNASAALSNTYTFAKYTKTPIISSSGLNPLTAPIAISYGAAGVGIGSFLNSCSSSLLRSKQINSLVHLIRNRESSMSQISLFSLKKFPCQIFLIYKQQKSTTRYSDPRFKEHIKTS